MKQFLDPVQTAYLQAIGFPAPKSVCKLSLDLDMDTIPSFSYSIGELLIFLPEKIYDVDEDVTAYLQIISGWEVFYKTYKDISYYHNSTELIDALYRMVIKLKDKGIILLQDKT